MIVEPPTSIATCRNTPRWLQRGVRPHAASLADSGREGSRTPIPASTGTDSQSVGLTDVQPFHLARGLAKEKERSVDALRSHPADAPNDHKLSLSLEFERTCLVCLRSVNHRQNNDSRFEFEPQVVMLERVIVRSNDKLTHGGERK